MDDNHHSGFFKLPNRGCYHESCFRSLPLLKVLGEVSCACLSSLHSRLQRCSVKMGFGAGVWKWTLAVTVAVLLLSAAVAGEEVL